ncbi:Far1 [Hordeum vulgare]|nr:Far1 [Hordeum vulgare]
MSSSVIALMLDNKTILPTVQGYVLDQDPSLLATFLYSPQNRRKIDLSSLAINHELLSEIRYILDSIIGGNFLGSHTVDSYGAIMNLVGSPPLMVNRTTLTLEHVMQSHDAIDFFATIELIEDLDRKIHNQITQYGSKVGMVLKNLREKEPIVNDSSRIGKLEDVITNLGSAFAGVQNTPNHTLKKTVKSVFVPKASGESYNKDEDLKMINDHTTYGLSTKDDYT